MPKIEIKTVTIGSGLPVSAWGTRFFMDGKEVAECRSVDLSFRVDELVTAKVEVFASESLDFHGDAHVNVTIMPLPGFEVVAEPRPDGTTRYRCEAVKDR